MDSSCRSCNEDTFSNRLGGSYLESLVRRFHISSETPEEEQAIANVWLAQYLAASELTIEEIWPKEFPFPPAFPWLANLVSREYVRAFQGEADWPHIFQIDPNGLLAEVLSSYPLETFFSANSLSVCLEGDLIAYVPASLDDRTYNYIMLFLQKPDSSYRLVVVEREACTEGTPNCICGWKVHLSIEFTRSSSFVPVSTEDTTGGGGIDPPLVGESLVSVTYNFSKIYRSGFGAIPNATLNGTGSVTISHTVSLDTIRSDGSETKLDYPYDVFLEATNVWGNPLLSPNPTWFEWREWVDASYCDQLAAGFARTVIEAFETFVLRVGYKHSTSPVETEVGDWLLWVGTVFAPDVDYQWYKTNCEYYRDAYAPDDVGGTPGSDSSP